MALGPRLEFRQTQSLVMTPQLLQAIKLLQLSTVELASYVEAELERNPLLERRDDPDAAPIAPAEAPVESGGATEGDWASDELRTDRAAIENDIGTDLSNAFPDDAVAPPASPLRQEGPTLPSLDGSRVSQGGGSDGDDRGLEDIVAGGLSLHDHLERQTLPLLDTHGDRAIALALIESIEDTGYLTEPVEEIAERLGTDPADVEAILAIIQQSEPIGVGARTLTECLALQLKDKDRYDPAMAALVDNLDLLARREFAQLRRICRVDEEDLADMVSEIRRLDPKPGLIFGGEPARVCRAGRLRPPCARWQLDGGAQRRRFAPCHRQPQLLRRVSRTKDPAGKSFIDEAWATANC